MIQYTLLLWPHANARYQQETRKLARAELRLMLDKLMPEAVVEIDESADMPCLSLSAPEPLTEDILSAIRAHSLLYGLFERREDGALLPVAGRADAVIGADLPAILKYKGKTNEMFLQLMTNVALYSGDYWRAEGPLEMLDPMCGRATAPFIALNRGWNATGADVDKNDLKEAEKFFKRYLEYHRVKHAVTRESRTIRGERGAQLTRFTLADTPEHFREKRTVSLSLVNLDAAKSAEAFGRNAFHLIVCDLPYGVAHDAQINRGAKAGGNWLETLLEQSLRVFYQTLRPGGTAALSFNAQTFRLEKLRGMMADAGFEVMRGGAYDTFEHWVEQAITRDIAVCRKPARP